MIGHCTLFRENDDLPLWRGPAVKKRRHILMCALILREVLPVKVASYSFDGLYSPASNSFEKCFKMFLLSLFTVF